MRILIEPDPQKKSCSPTSVSPTEATCCGDACANNEDPVPSFCVDMSEVGAETILHCGETCTD